jgi:AraC family transcriptional regulator of adaptative response / DNA-3-methyladenine glycosylase II
MRALIALPGIGEWTAQYIAMRALGWPDAFLAGDLIVRRVLGEARPARVLARSEAWRPWRAYAVLHLWRKAA